MGMQSKRVVKHLFPKERISERYIYFEAVVTLNGAKDAFGSGISRAIRR